MEPKSRDKKEGKQACGLRREKRGNKHCTPGAKKRGRDARAADTSEEEMREHCTDGEAEKQGDVGT
jgi:hypothetical protein